jgi:hypothetical protein
MTLSACRQLACVKTLGNGGEAYLNACPMQSFITQPIGLLDIAAQEPKLCLEESFRDDNLKYLVVQREAGLRSLGQPRFRHRPVSRRLHCARSEADGAFPMSFGLITQSSVRVRCSGDYLVGHWVWEGIIGSEPCWRVSILPCAPTSEGMMP